MLQNILDGLGICGDIAFTVGAVIAARKDTDSFFTQTLSSISTAILGGFLRDLGLFRTTPHIFGTWWELPLVIVIAIISALAVNRNWNINPGTAAKLNAALGIADTVSVVAFALIGAGHGFEHSGGSPVIAAIAGFLTAAGGGCIAILFKSLAQNRGTRISYLISTFYRRKNYIMFCAAVSIAYVILAQTALK